MTSYTLHTWHALHKYINTYITSLHKYVHTCITCIHEDRNQRNSQMRRPTYSLHLLFDCMHHDTLFTYDHFTQSILIIAMLCIRTKEQYNKSSHAEQTHTNEQRNTHTHHVTQTLSN